MILITLFSSSRMLRSFNISPGRMIVACSASNLFRYDLAKSGVYLIFFTLLFACESKPEKDLVKEGMEMHDLSVRIGKHVDNKIKMISHHAEKSGDPLRTILNDSARKLRRDLEFWESMLFEVPGHEHEHEDFSDHKDHKQPEPGLTDGMMLAVQADLRDNILKLNIRAQKIIKTYQIGKYNEFSEEE